MTNAPPISNREERVEGLSESDIAGFSEQSTVPMMAIDRELRYVFANKAYCEAVGLPKAQLIGKFVFDVDKAPIESEDAFRHMCGLTFTGEITRSEVLTTLVTGEDGRTRPVYRQTTQEPFALGDGEIRYVMQRVEDITHLVELQKSHDVIAAELDHRVKNFVSVILATARITSASATSVEQYTEDFCSRVDSMARIYSHMSSLGLMGLDLRSLFEVELAQVSSQKAIPYSLKGNDIQLTAKATRDGGMIIHEFVTNAVKHGCFSHSEGRLDVEWEVSDGYLRLLWVESGLTGVRPPQKKGFSTRLIEMLPNAKVTCDYRDTGLVMEYVVPADLVLDEVKQEEVWLSAD
nr:HWE histidine kinase domain-containing protein [uncultured Hyphomonas sp.]